MVRCILLGTLIVLNACGSGSINDLPAEVEVDLSMTFNVQSQSADGDGTITDTKSISGQSGDPWGSFISSARAEMGTDPTELEVLSVSVTVAPTSSGVSTLGDIFNGPMAVRFEMTSSRQEYRIAEGDHRQEDAATTTDLLPVFDFSQVSIVDYRAMLNGAFDVLFVGQANDDFKDASASADLTVVITIKALEGFAVTPDAGP